jgi:hypothetical protein
VVILRHIFNVAVLSGTVTPAAPEVLAPEVEAPTTLTLVCPPDVPRVETLITCTVTGGDGATAVLWRASFGETFAGAGVSLGPTGTGTFSFSVPRTALGRELVVELVDWSAPLSLGTVEGPVPASIPSGGGPAATTAALIAIAAVLVGGASRRRSARSRG